MSHPQPPSHPLTTDDLICYRTFVDKLTRMRAINHQSDPELDTNFASALTNQHRITEEIVNGGPQALIQDVQAGVKVLLNRMATEIKEDMNQLLRGSEARVNNLILESKTRTKKALEDLILKDRKSADGIFLELQSNIADIQAAIAKIKETLRMT
ncbi:hypothetical protein PGT21_036713 [Puccinia graminis f. sp. tritici]|uniref:Uncharacterized protein n=1 Tax=Puccinia graminis f. sp. tritici TaxID=56615 RepID=A0A5B0QDU7_PUCGR|nr:hypothetical protein PGT21_036713 [Puccinia graminis f. sp. tritici]